VGPNQAHRRLAHGVPDEASDYVWAIGAKWLISAVAHIYKPGCKADHMLIAEGPQGLFKSTAFQVLGEPWFTDNIEELGTKDSQLATLGRWIIELAELDALTRAELSRVKAFLSRSIDRFRPPYGRRLIESPRQCVFVGTVNHGEYLRDETGGRRFWPVELRRRDRPRSPPPRQRPALGRSRSPLPAGREMVAGY
jgi:predicted P-loop ATPase